MCNPLATCEAGYSVYNGKVYDREAIGGVITDYQGYATEDDIDRYILALEK